MRTLFLHLLLALLSARCTGGNAPGDRLAAALLGDMLPPSSSACAEGGGETRLRFDFQPSDAAATELLASSEWDKLTETYEQQLFAAEMRHTDARSARVWKLRLGKAGHVYSFVGRFGEVVPPQRAEDAPWIDEVWQSVATASSKNEHPHTYAIHQAGAYSRDEALQRVPFYSPSLGSHCSGRECSFATWGTQAHTPTKHKSSAIFMNRYRDCGDGVLELTSLVHNFAAVGGDTLDDLSMPWAGIRTSTLNDIVLSQKDNSSAVIYDLDAPMQAWAQDTHAPNAQDTAGYTVFAQNLECPTCLNFSMPCADATTNAVVNCSDATSAGAPTLKITSCLLAEDHTETHGQETIRCELQQTVALNEGCPVCSLYFTNAGSGKSILVKGVINWALNGTQLLFWPDTRVNNITDVNAVFSQGATIHVTRADSGRPTSENLAFALVHGLDREYGNPSKNGIKFNGKTRIRFGVTTDSDNFRDYTKFSVNSRIKVEPGDTFVTRHYLIADEYVGLDARAAKWVNETYQAQFHGVESNQSNHTQLAAQFLPVSWPSSNCSYPHMLNCNKSQSIRLYSQDGGRTFGAAAGDDGCGGPKDAMARCSGWSTAREGARPLFALQCGEQSYVGADPYHFAPMRPNDSMPVRAYLCRDMPVTARPNVTLLGWFQDGACVHDLLNATYDPHYCPGPAPLPTSPAGNHAVTIKIAVPLELGDLTEGLQLDFRRGVAQAAEVEIAQVVIESITARDGTTQTPSRTLLGSNGNIHVTVQVVGLSESGAEQVSTRVTTTRLRETMIAQGLPAPTLLQPPSVVNPDQDQLEYTTVLDEQLTAHSASGVGGLWRDPYGTAVAADSPAAWWRLNHLSTTTGTGGLRESPCISCAASGSGGPVAHGGGVRRGLAACGVDEAWCVIKVDAPVSVIPGIPNSEALVRRQGSAYVAAPGVAAQYSPQRGERISAASAGASGTGAALRLNGHGGLKMPYSNQLFESTFTFELWLRVGKAGMRGSREQAVASCGWVQVCDAHSDATCSHRTRAATNHGWELLLKRDGKMALRLALRQGAPMPHGSSGKTASSRAVGQAGALGAGSLEIETKTDVQPLLTDQWTLVTVVVDAAQGGMGHGRQGTGGHGSVTLYLNASLAATAPLPKGEYIPPLQGNGQLLLVGQPNVRRAAPNFLTGDVDEIALFRSALSHKKIIQHFLAVTYEPNHVRPHINCERTTTDSPTSTARQTHTNPVQSCAVADQGLKRLLGFGNVPTETVTDAAISRGSQVDGPDFASTPQRAQSDVGISKPVIVPSS